MIYILIYLTIAYLCAAIFAAAALSASSKDISGQAAIAFVVGISVGWPVVCGVLLRGWLLSVRDAVVARWKARRVKA